MITVISSFTFANISMHMQLLPGTNQLAFDLDTDSSSQPTPTLRRYPEEEEIADK